MNHIHEQATTYAKEHTSTRCADMASPACPCSYARSCHFHALRSAYIDSYNINFKSQKQ